MASGIYTILKTNLMNKAVNLASDSIYVALINASYSFNAAHTTWAAESANEISGTGYVTNGMALSGQSVSAVGTTAVWTASTVTWTSASFTAYGTILYDSSVSNDLIAAIDFGGALTVASGTFAIIWSGNGIIVLS